MINDNSPLNFFKTAVIIATLGKLSMITVKSLEKINRLGSWDRAFAESFTYGAIRRIRYSFEIQPIINHSDTKA